MITKPTSRMQMLKAAEALLEVMLDDLRYPAEVVTRIDRAAVALEELMDAMRENKFATRLGAKGRNTSGGH